MPEDIPFESAESGKAEPDESRALDSVMAERHRLLSLAFRMMGTLADAEDVVQETYELVTRSRAGLPTTGYAQGGRELAGLLRGGKPPRTAGA